jgi:parvulin-like peptidyl-prolyl isomerase
VGPVRSGYGWHLVFISKRNKAAEIPFASVKEDVKTKWLGATKETQNKKTFDKLGEKYIIKRRYLQTK